MVEGVRLGIGAVGLGATIAFAVAGAGVGGDGGAATGFGKAFAGDWTEAVGSACALVSGTLVLAACAGWIDWSTAAS